MANPWDNIGKWKPSLGQTYNLGNIDINYPLYSNNPYAYTSKNNNSSSNADNIVSLLSRQVLDEFVKNNKSFENSGVIGQALGNLFGSGENKFKWSELGNNFLKDLGVSLASTGVGIASNLIGQGITSLGGDTPISRGFGSAVATGLGSIGGTIASNLIKHGKIAGNATKLFGTGGSGWARFSTGNAALNPYSLGMSVVGAGLQAGLGPSKEYLGKYGNITRSMDTAYDAIQAGVGFIPGYGQAIAGALALNKGLSNLFGSTDAMTVQDAILGSAFMPAPIKWLNAGFGSKTGSFDNQSFQNSELATNFMQDGFGNLQEYFDRATNEANKTYGLFSQGAKKSALNNIDWSNNAWLLILDMAHLNRYLNIRSQDMASINNLRYAQTIEGGWNPVAIGKQGMKLLNNQTNHNIGMRLLSAAALIDNKQMILSALTGTKIEFKSELDWSPESWFSKRVKKPDGTLYNKQEAKILASHVPEYHTIEKESKANGTWLKMPDGSTWEGDPRSWVMMLSEAFKKNYSSKLWYTGLAEWPTIFDYPNDNQKAIETDKITRAPYYNGLMWFSNDKTYGDAFAYLYKSSGVGYRKNDPREKNIWGHNFLAAIPKKGIYRSLASPKKGTSDYWKQMPYFLKDNNIYRLPNSQIYNKDHLWVGKVNYRKDRKEVLTDDVVNWSKNLGDQGIFLHKVSDGQGIKIKSPEIMHKVNNKQPVKNEDFEYTYPILEEFISQPGFTNKVKFIEGNTGDFDINNPYKYAYNKINQNKQMILSAQNGTKVNYKPDWSDKLEPYAAGLGLVGDAAGLTVASTGIGIPVGVSIAQAANIPSTVIDGYLTIRDGIRAYQNNGLGVDNALLNGTELLLDVTGLKILSNLNKAKKAGISAEKILSATEKNATSSYRRVGTGAGRALAKESAKRKAMYNVKRNKALQESIKVLNKRGIRRVLGDYFERKLADEMAKRGFGVSVNDAIQSTNNTLRVNLGIANSASAGVNIYDILDNKSK